MSERDLSDAHLSDNWLDGPLTAEAWAAPRSGPFG